MRIVLLILAASVALSGCGLAPRPCQPRLESVGTGLTHPRGIAIADDGTIYVAEAGNEAIGGRVSRIQTNGRVTHLTTGLPHSVNAGVEDVGASGIALRRGDVYVSQGEAGGELAAALLRLRPGGGSPEKVADFDAFETRFNPDDDQPESNPFGLLYDTAQDVFFATDAAANTLLRVSPTGEIVLVAVWRDGLVPTGLARGPDGALYVSLFGRFPHRPRSGRIDRVEGLPAQRSGSVTTVARDLTMPVGIVFSPEGTLLVLEFAAGFETSPQLRFIPESGRLLRIRGDRRETVAERLPFPIGLAHDRQGRLFLSLYGAMSPPGSGVVARLVPCR